MEDDTNTVLTRPLSRFMRVHPIVTVSLHSVRGKPEPLSLMQAGRGAGVGLSHASAGAAAAPGASAALPPARLRSLPISGCAVSLCGRQLGSVCFCFLTSSAVTGVRILGWFLRPLFRVLIAGREATPLLPSLLPGGVCPRRGRGTPGWQPPDRQSADEAGGGRGASPPRGAGASPAPGLPAPSSVGAQGAGNGVSG